MRTLTFSIDILASTEHVWNTMLNQASYKEWTAAFAPGCSYEGSWEQGTKMRFLGPNGSGMFSEVAENRPYAHLSVRHIGYDENGKKVTFTPALYEKYTFTVAELGTRLQVDLDVLPEFEVDMTEAWPKALAQLKEICQRPGPAVEVTSVISAPLAHVWQCWIEPKHITGWAFASPDWAVGNVENDVRAGGRFLTNMHAKDGSAGFDFTGTYTVVEPQQRLIYRTDDSRVVEVTFAREGNGTRVTERFETERVYPPEMQQAGWQSILDNFRTYTESAPQA